MKTKTVRWRDACSSDTWQAIGDVPKKPVIITSIGYVIDENEDYIALAHSVSEDGYQHAGFISIPKTSILKGKKPFTVTSNTPECRGGYTGNRKDLFYVDTSEHERPVIVPTNTTISYGKKSDLWVVGAVYAAIILAAIIIAIIKY